jgi:hypothetical protein
MPHAILVAFEYRAVKVACEPITGDRTQDKSSNCEAVPFVNFPGAIIDLHLVYSFCRDQKWSTTMLTDITEERYPPNIVSLATSGAVNVGALQFFKDHNHTFRYCTDRKTFIKHLREECSRPVDDKKMIFYYTGHGIRTTTGIVGKSGSSILLPNNEVVDFNEFSSIITQTVPGDYEIMCVLDCCHPGSLSLPYKLRTPQLPSGAASSSPQGVDIKSDGSCIRSERSDGSPWELLPKYQPIKQKLLCITSATFDEDSNSLPHGSIFTNIFFTHMSQLTVDLPLQNTIISWPSRSLKSIALWATGEIQKRHLLRQTVAIYSSYKIAPILPLWIGKLTWNFTFDLHSKLIIGHTGRADYIVKTRTKQIKKLINPL